jgi:uncharacterized protein (TIGR02145 family)
MKKCPQLIIIGFSLVLLNCAKDDEINFGTVIDIDGNSYKTIAIRNQTWMAENLKVLHFNNGDPIQNITSKSEWINLTTPAFCWYNNDESSNKDNYGALYNFYVINNNKNICPTGWRIPTKNDFELLESVLGGKDIAGERLKETGTNYWFSPNEQCATNSSKFSARGGGARNSNGTFEYIRQTAHFWTETILNNTACFYMLSFEGSGLFFNYAEGEYGFSIRCIKESGK